MDTRERPHFVIKTSEMAKWLDREPTTWWLVDGDPRLTGKIDFPCPSGELSEALRYYQKDLFVYPAEPASAGRLTPGQSINWQRLNDLSEKDNPDKARTFLLSWSDRDDYWLLEEYPLSEREESHH